VLQIDTFRHPKSNFWLTFENNKNEENYFPIKRWTARVNSKLYFISPFQLPCRRLFMARPSLSGRKISKWNWSQPFIQIWNFPAAGDDRRSSICTMYDIHITENFRIPLFPIYDGGTIFMCFPSFLSFFSSFSRFYVLFVSDRLLTRHITASGGNVCTKTSISYFNEPSYTWVYIWNRN
jgi:hypothetical protein